jgi:hypothetical protein
MPPSGGTGVNRIRLTMTDGMLTIMGMLSGLMVQLVENGSMKENSLIVLKETLVNDLNGKK